MSSNLKKMLSQKFYIKYCKNASYINSKSGNVLLILEKYHTQTLNGFPWIPLYAMKMLLGSKTCNYIYRRGPHFGLLENASEKKSIAVGIFSHSPLDKQCYGPL